ncbi:response regulator [bacterium]|nr:response regulator [bacterium]
METTKQRILIVDDDVCAARCLKMGLEVRGGYEVRDESSGLGGLSAARTFRPDLILLDVCMPDMDGGAVAAAIRADPQLKYTPIVFLTALVAPEEEPPHGLKSAGFQFVPKPVTIPKAIACIKEHLGSPPVCSATP